MAIKSEKAFPKPTAIALLAAALGVAIHLAVFFLVRIETEPLADHSETRPHLTFSGEIDPTAAALIDPLTLLVRSGQNPTGPGLEDFRSLSISREISPFPPFFDLEENREWTAWMPPEITEENPGAWLLERTESSLQSFGRAPLSSLALPPDQMTLQRIDLLRGETRVSPLPLPESVEKPLREATFPGPVTFLIDRTDPWSRPQALLVQSSGDVGVDQALRATLSGNGENGAIRGSYSLVTYYLPPVRPSSEETLP